MDSWIYTTNLSCLPAGPSLDKLIHGHFCCHCFIATSTDWVRRRPEKIFIIIVCREQPLFRLTEQPHKATFVLLVLLIGQPLVGRIGRPIAMQQAHVTLGGAVGPKARLEATSKQLLIAQIQGLIKSRAHAWEVIDRVGEARSTFREVKPRVCLDQKGRKFTLPLFLRCVSRLDQRTNSPKRESCSGYVRRIDCQICFQAGWPMSFRFIQTGGLCTSMYCSVHMSSRLSESGSQPGNQNIGEACRRRIRCGVSTSKLRCRRSTVRSTSSRKLRPPCQRKETSVRIESLRCHEKT